MQFSGLITWRWLLYDVDTFDLTHSVCLGGAWHDLEEQLSEERAVVDGTRPVRWSSHPRPQLGREARGDAAGEPYMPAIADHTSNQTERRVMFRYANPPIRSCMCCFRGGGSRILASADTDARMVVVACGAHRPRKRAKRNVSPFVTRGLCHFMGRFTLYAKPSWIRDRWRVHNTPTQAVEGLVNPVEAARTTDDASHLAGRSCSAISCT